MVNKQRISSAHLMHATVTGWLNMTKSTFCLGRQCDSPLAPLPCTKRTASRRSSSVVFRHSGASHMPPVCPNRFLADLSSPGSDSPSSVIEGGREATVAADKTSMRLPLASSSSSESMPT